MKTHTSLISPAFAACCLALVMATSSATAVTVIENFEGSTLGDGTPPAGWSLITVTADPDTAYLTTTGANGLGLGGQITGNHSSNGSGVPGAYIVNSGSPAFDASQAISGSFDFFLPEAGNYTSGLFILGNVLTGVTGTDAGEYLGMLLREQTFGARADIINGAGASLATDNNNRISTNAWYGAEFTWTPTSGLTGDLSFSVTGPHNWTETFTGYTFDSPDAYLGFGTGGYFSGDFSPIFDNINITGSLAVIPEPRTALLAGFGLLTLLARRRR